MHKMLFIDPDRCTGCRICVMACSLSKTNTFNPIRSRISIAKWEEEGIMVPIMCQHCEEPLCMIACPVDARSKDKETGIVRINDQVCIGCRMCIMVCPFGGPSFDPVESKVVICDLCDGNPQCVDVCPTGALQYIRADRSAAMKRRGAMEKIRRAITTLGETQEPSRLDVTLFEGVI